MCRQGHARPRRRSCPRVPIIAQLTTASTATATAATRAPLSSAAPAASAASAASPPKRSASILLIEPAGASAGMCVVVQLRADAGRFCAVRVGVAGSLSLAGTIARLGTRLCSASAAAIPARAVSSVRAGLLARAGRGGRVPGLRLRLRLVRGAAQVFLVLRLLQSGGGIDGLPASIAPLAPIAIRVLFVNVAISAGVHIVIVRVFRHESAVSILAAEARSLASLRSLKRAHGSVRVGIVLRFRPVTAVRHDAASPLRILIVALRSGCVRSRPRIVGLRIGAGRRRRSDMSRPGRTFPSPGYTRRLFPLKRTAHTRRGRRHKIPCKGCRRQPPRTNKDTDSRSDIADRK